MKNLLKYKAVKPYLWELPRKGDVYFILDRANLDWRHGFQVCLVDKVEGLDVHLIYLPGPKAAKTKVMVRPIQGVDVLVRATDAQHNMDFYSYEIDSNNDQEWSEQKTCTECIKWREVCNVL